MHLTGKNAIVTGGSRGIGRAVALALAEAGASVAIIYAGNTKAAEETKQAVEEKGVQAMAIQCDVSDEKAVADMVKAVKKEWGRVDILVNNAGISHIGLMMDMSNDEWERIIQTNLSSVFYCSRAAVPAMISRKSGKIINISSMWGTSGASCEVAYSASKSGMNGFTRALAKELAPSNIQVNAIACGVIDTIMNQQLSAEERKALEEEIPAGRYGTVEEIADMIWNVANAPAYMTGQVIGIDGGIL